MKRVKRVVLPLAAAGAAAAALTSGLAGAHPLRDAALPNGLHGIVYRSPITPVCRTGVPCEAPAPNVRLIFTRPGFRASSAKTARDGSYRILLPAAIYAVQTDRAGIGKRPYPARVKVRRGHVDKLDFRIDTGIR